VRSKDSHKLDKALAKKKRKREVLLEHESARVALEELRRQAENQNEVLSSQPRPQWTFWRIYRWTFGTIFSVRLVFYALTSLSRPSPFWVVDIAVSLSSSAFTSLVVTMAIAGVLVLFGKRDRHR